MTAPASKDGWAKGKRFEIVLGWKNRTTFTIQQNDQADWVGEQIEAALLEAHSRGALRTLAACTETIRETSEQNGKMLAEKWGDEALLREIGTAFATCLRYADPRAFNISTGKFFKEEWDEIVRKVEARLTPKGTGEKEK